MSQTIPDGAVSDPDPDPSGSGTGDDGAAASNGAPTDGSDAFAAERDRLEAQNRRLQGDRDRLAAQLARATAPEPVAPPANAGEGITLADFRAEMRRAQALHSAASSLRDEFPYASPDLFAGVDDFDSPEQFAQAVEDSHQHVAAMIQPAIDAEVAKVRSQYEAKYGPIASSSPSATEAGAPSGLPQSVQEYNQLSWAEQDKLDKDHPGLLDSLTAKAMQ